MSSSRTTKNSNHFWHFFFFVLDGNWILFHKSSSRRRRWKTGNDVEHLARKWTIAIFCLLYLFDYLMVKWCKHLQSCNSCYSLYEHSVVHPGWFFSTLILKLLCVHNLFSPSRSLHYSPCSTTAAGFIGGRQLKYFPKIMKSSENWKYRNR